MATENMAKSFTIGVITGIGLSICYEQLYNSEWAKNLKNKLFASNVKLNSQPSAEPVALNESVQHVLEKNDEVVDGKKNINLVKVQSVNNPVNDHTEDNVNEDDVNEDSPMNDHPVMLIASST